MSSILGPPSVLRLPITTSDLSPGLANDPAVNGCPLNLQVAGLASQTAFAVAICPLQPADKSGFSKNTGVTTDPRNMPLGAICALVWLSWKPNSLYARTLGATSRCAKALKPYCSAGRRK